MAEARPTETKGWPANPTAFGIALKNVPFDAPQDWDRGDAGSGDQPPPNRDAALARDRAERVVTAAGDQRCGGVGKVGDVGT